MFDAYWADFKDDKIIFSFLSEKLISENNIRKDTRLSYDVCVNKKKFNSISGGEIKPFLNGLVEMTEHDYAYLTER